MIRAFTSEADIAAAQAMLRDEFYAGAEVLQRTIGFPGGSTVAEVAWHASAGIWGYVDTPESALGPDGVGGRYWNAFGLDNPVESSNLSITVEVNPPLRGTNARVGGILGRGTDGSPVLLHRGTIGGGRAGVGRELFVANFQGKYEFVADGDGLADCAYVATLGQGTLVAELRRFVDEVARMKALVRR